MKEDKKRLIIIDANALIHRAFHALPPLTTKKGELVNAVYGFFLVFFRAIKEFKPDFIATAFDFPAPGFRHQKYKLYKANRPKAPKELYSQIPKVKKILEKFNIPVFEKEGYEADDLIGTISKAALKKQIFPSLEIIILSGDTDVLQLVDKNIKAYILRKGVKDIVLYDKEKVKEKYQGLSPSQIVDFKSLRGDPSDNIPGVSGIGEKSAIELLKKFGTVENLYENLRKNSDDLKKIKSSFREKLSLSKEQAFVSKMLAKIRIDAPIDFDLKKCRWGDYDKKEIIRIFEEYDFKSLILRISENKENKEEKEIIKNQYPEEKEIFKNNLKLC